MSYDKNPDITNPDQLTKFLNYEKLTKNMQCLKFLSITESDDNSF